MFVHARSGLPTLRAKLRDGGRLRVLAFGTSITAGGQYLAHVVPALERASPGLAVELTTIGLPGFDTVVAALNAHDAARCAPDLAIVELGINDHSQSVRPYIADALYGIVAQLRAAAPACDVLFAFAGRFGVDRGMEDAAMTIHRAVAEALDLPSIDLFAFANALVARGEAEAIGGGERAITVDGTHHAPAAARILGVPFADAIVALARESNGAVRPLPSLPPTTEFLVTDRFDGEALCRMTMERHFMTDFSVVSGVIVAAGPARPATAGSPYFTRARSFAPHECIASGDWSNASVPPGSVVFHRRTDVLVALAAGAKLGFSCGPFFCVMGLAGETPLRVTIDGARIETQPAMVGGASSRAVWMLVVSQGLSDAPHAVEIEALAPHAIGFTDIYAVMPASSRDATGAGAGAR